MPSDHGRNDDSIANVPIKNLQDKEKDEMAQKFVEETEEIVADSDGGESGNSSGKGESHHIKGDSVTGSKISPDTKNIKKAGLTEKSGKKGKKIVSNILSL